MNAEIGYRTVHVNGIDLNVAIAGEGLPVLLVHGFPDDHTVWRAQIPALVAAGYRVIAPDTRGCGDSELLPTVADYRIGNLVADLAALLDALAIDTVRLVAHDWGAVIGWQFVMSHPERVERYMALSVGHPAAFRRAGLLQRLRSYYIYLFQIRGLAEFLLRLGNFGALGRLGGRPQEVPHWRERLSRPGRLTAAINYYRANVRLLVGGDETPATVPVHGVWSSNDVALVERQMTGSARYVSAPWRYTRIEGVNHWLQLDAPERINPLLLDYLGAPMTQLGEARATRGEEGR